LKTYLEQPEVVLLKPDFQRRSRKIRPSKLYVDAWEELKKQLCNAKIRAFPGFSRPFILYVDGSKEHVSFFASYRSFARYPDMMNKSRCRSLEMFKSLAKEQTAYVATVEKLRKEEKLVKSLI
jgi:spore germination protein YaaH